jgi:hypothetical protein
MLLPGFHQWTQAEYRRRVSDPFHYTASTICRLARDPREPSITESTPAMLIGSALHTALLEPADFADRHPVAPKCDKRTTAGKQAFADFVAGCRADSEPITSEQYDAVRKGIDAVDNNRDARALISAHGMREGSAVASFDLDAYDGAGSLLVHAGARPDLVTVDATLVQVKTSWNGYDPRRFAHTLRDMRYLAGEAWCAAITAAAGGFAVERIAFVVVEAPTSERGRGACRVYSARVDGAALSAGFEQACKAIRRHQRWLKNAAEVTAELDYTVDISDWEV